MKSGINWSYFPKTDPLPEVLLSSIKIFEKNFVSLHTKVKKYER